MTELNRNPTRPTRKGIHAHFDAAGNLIGDERWQIVEGAGGVRYDAEVTRPGPFPEPRRESWTFTLRAGPAERWQPDRLAVRTTTDREARLDWLPGDAGPELLLCWRAGATTRRTERGWTPDGGALLLSPFSITTLLRGPTRPGETIDVVLLEPVDFAPRFAKIRVRRAGWLACDTLGGRRHLEVVEIDDVGGGIGHRVYVDADGLVREWVHPHGDYTRLTAISDP